MPKLYHIRDVLTKLSQCIDLFEMNAQEVAVSQSSYLSPTMIPKSDQFEFVIRVVRNINRRLVVFCSSLKTRTTPTCRYEVWNEFCMDLR